LFSIFLCFFHPAHDDTAGDASGQHDPDDDHVWVPHGGSGDNAAFSDGSGGESSSDEAGGPVPSDLELNAALQDLSGPSYQAVVAHANQLLRQSGYPNLHQNKGRKDHAYYYCGCGDKTCFKVQLERRPVGHKKGYIWVFESIGERNCEPGSIVGIAYANSFIPVQVKAVLMQHADEGLTPGEAHNLAAAFAAANNLPTTWERSDVKNLFQMLHQEFSERTVSVMSNLTKAGHFVAVDLKTDGNGKQILNRLFASFLSGQDCYIPWGTRVATLDSTYG
jgi:hypothetical protein